MARADQERYMATTGIEWRRERLRKIVERTGQGILHLTGRGTDDLAVAPFGRWLLEARDTTWGSDGRSLKDNKHVIATRDLDPSVLWTPDGLELIGELGDQATGWIQEGCKLGGLEVMGGELHVVVNPQLQGRSTLHGAFLVRSARALGS
jgi:hypothetical protein